MLLAMTRTKATDRADDGARWPGLEPEQAGAVHLDPVKGECEAYCALGHTRMCSWCYTSQKRVATR